MATHSMCFIRNHMKLCIVFKFTFSSCLVVLDCEKSGTEITSVPKSLLISKSYPNVYDQNSDCEATVKFEQNENIVLYFWDFKVQDTSGCTKDYLEISSITNKKRAIGDRLCGYTLPPPIPLNAGTAHLAFQSDAMLGYKGFIIHLDTGEICIYFSV